MVIQDLIGDIVGQLTVEGSSPSVAPTFIHGNPGWQNLKVDETVNDIVILDEPIVSNDTYRQGGLLEEAYLLRLIFLTKSELDYSPEQQKPLISAMRKQRRKFINKLSSQVNLTIRNFGSIQTTDLVNVFNVNLTGVMLSITITPLDPNSRC